MYLSIYLCHLCLQPNAETFNHMDFFGLFRAATAAYGGSQARGPIGAVAAGLHNSNTRSELHL